MTKTVIHRNDNKTVERAGTSGFTVTSNRIGNDLDVLIEFDEASYNESVAQVAMLLVQLEELHGENFIAQIFNHYAEETDKMRTRGW